MSSSNQTVVSNKSYLDGEINAMLGQIKSISTESKSYIKNEKMILNIS